MDKAITNPIEFANGVPGWMTEPELAWVSKTASALPPGSSWLEVGTWMGKSWSCVALSLPENCLLTCVDTFEGEFAEPLKWCQENGSAFPHFMRAYGQVRPLRPDLTLSIHVMKSVQGARCVPDCSQDVVFIDGDHREEMVRADVAAWLPKLKKGGLMCGHDISDPRVVTALNGGYNYAHDPNVSGSIWWLR